MADLDENEYSEVCLDLNHHLLMRSFFVGYSFTDADREIYKGLISNPEWKNLKMTKYPNLARWFLFCSSFDEFKSFGDVELSKNRKGTLPDLPGAEVGKCVFRFAPEPSGYLHIGHCKAVLLNYLYCKKYKGTLILRFDDTNPSKEKDEYVNTITEDLELLGIKPDKITHSSDYFDQGIEIAEKMIREGKAYCDDTPVEEMRYQKENLIPSKHRDNTVEENMRMWNEMKQGTEYGKKCILRAKIDYKSPNGALRDPALFRVIVDTPHMRTGDKYKVYPLYDFSCPFVDAIEGVTHAMRSNEFHDRDEQYRWLQEAMGFKPNHIIDFSRINFKYQLLSKRKLQWFVDTKRVEGWDDPRFPSVRGILRRGLTKEALQQFILEQGASKNTNLMDMSKIWAINKSIIDPIIPRYTAIGKDNVVKFYLSDWDKGFVGENRPKHRKNPELGEKLVYYNNVILIEAEDAKLLTVNEEITLMDWGNAIVDEIIKDGDKIVEIKGHLHLEGDFKKTKYKLTWLAYSEDKLIHTKLIEYDNLIVKPSLTKEEKFEDFVNEVTYYETLAYGDHNLASLKKGDLLQLERRGYFRCDADPATTGNVVHLIRIPDGKESGPSILSSKVKLKMK